MKPVKTKETTSVLVLDEEKDKPQDQRRGDLPIAKVLFKDPETGVERPGFESTWELEDGERRALANGATLTLRVWGSGHPPVNMAVGEPDTDSAKALISVEDAKRAASKFFELLAARMEELEGGEIGPQEIPAMYNRALRDVLHPPRGTGRNGNGNGAAS
jgi:hypothetical protein